MRSAHTFILALSVLTAASALAVGTQTPSDIQKTKTSYNGFTDQELAQSVAQADKAYAAKDITAVHENLRQLINCLAGPGGAGFDANIENPCKRMGRGAMMDVTADSDEHRLITKAFNEAKNGLATQDVKTARDLSKKALNDLEDAQTATQQ